MIHGLKEFWHSGNGILHRVHCHCGWAGGVRLTEQTAEADLAAHLVEIAAIEATS